MRVSPDCLSIEVIIMRMSEKDSIHMQIFGLDKDWQLTIQAVSAVREFVCTTICQVRVNRQQRTIR